MQIAREKRTSKSIYESIMLQYLKSHYNFPDEQRKKIVDFERLIKKSAF